MSPDDASPPQGRSIKDRLLLLMTAAPLLYLPVMISAVASTGLYDSPPLWTLIGFAAMFPVSWAIMAFVIVHVTTRNKRLDSNERIMWVALLFFFSIVIAPVYVWKYCRSGK